MGLDGGSSAAKVFIPGPSKALTDVSKSLQFLLNHAYAIDPIISTIVRLPEIVLHISVYGY